VALQPGAELPLVRPGLVRLSYWRVCAYSGYHPFPLVALGTVLLVGALLGRLLCGWVCPFGLVQDWLFRIPSPKIELPGWAAHLKYGVLILFVFLFPFLLGEATWLSFCRICPAAALQVTLPAVISDGLGSVRVATLVRLVVLAGVLALAILSSRSFCKALCPIGALLAPLNFASFWQVKPPRAKCLSCHRCDQSCSLQVQPSVRFAKQLPANRALDCIVCHDCQKACATAVKMAKPEPPSRPVTANQCQ